MLTNLLKKKLAPFIKAQNIEGSIDDLQVSTRDGKDYITFTTDQGERYEAETTVKKDAEGKEGYTLQNFTNLQPSKTSESEEKPAVDIEKAATEQAKSQQEAVGEIITAGQTDDTGDKPEEKSAAGGETDPSTPNGENPDGSQEEGVNTDPEQPNADETEAENEEDYFLDEEDIEFVA